MLFYSLYGYAYYVFGATFNDAFLAHIAIFSLSVFALACALPALDYAAIAREFRGVVGVATGVGIFLIVVGVAQGGLWLYVLANNIATGEVLHDIPIAGQHLVFALDLALLAPTLVVSGILLARRRPVGYLLGTAVAVMGAVYQVNMMVAGCVPGSRRRRGRAGVRAGEPVPDRNVRGGRARDAGGRASGRPRQGPPKLRVGAPRFRDRAALGWARGYAVRTVDV